MPPSGIRILMAEDSPSDAELARHAFKNDAYPNQLTIVKDGEEALAYLRKQVPFENAERPDVIILDLNMPKIGGREVLTEIKQDKQLRNIPVIILTTSEDEDDIKRSYELQASSYVTKPVEFENFMTVAKVIQKFYFDTVTLPPQPDVD
jgi:CheY-like chemotaxis protein